jgi:hypothetical protein
MEMRLVAVVSLLLASLVGIADESSGVIRLSEPVASTAISETFGAELTSGKEALTLATLMEDPGNWTDKTVRVQTRVAKVCQKKGCFFVAQDGATSVRVSFRDYGFFVPTDIGGKTVLLEGSLIRLERSEEQARHQAEDLGGETTVAPGLAWEIIADAVQVPRG